MAKSILTHDKPIPVTLKWHELPEGHRRLLQDTYDLLTDVASLKDDLPDRIRGIAARSIMGGIERLQFGSPADALASIGMTVNQTDDDDEDDYSKIRAEK